MERRTLYIADLHLDHYNMIKIDRRPFSSVEEMNRVIVNSWNEEVNDGDDVWVLGDVCMKLTPAVRECLSQMKGSKHLVIGNHDKVGKYSDYYEFFEDILDYATFRDSGLQVCLFHYPIESWDRMLYGSVHLHGHVHGNLWDTTPRPNRYNAWVKRLDWRPRTLEWFMKKFGYQPDYYKNLFKWVDADEYDDEA